MRIAGFALLLMSAPLHAAAFADLRPGTYSNEEQVYFDKEAGKAGGARWVAVEIESKAGHVTVQPVDAFGAAFGAPRPMTGIVTIGPDAITFTQDDGQVAMLRRARTATCWGSVPRVKLKADGRANWYFVSGLKLFDQGGRARFGGGDTGAPQIIIRMRNVVWPSGTNKPSLVLYVHKPDSPDHAEAYSWADPGARRIGINLRWMQASCSIDDP